MELGHIDSIILVTIFVVYLIWMIISAKKARTDTSQKEDYKSDSCMENHSLYYWWCSCN